MADVQALVMAPGQYMQAADADRACEGILLAFEQINSALQGANYHLPITDRNTLKDLRRLNCDGAAAHMVDNEDAAHAWANALQALALANLPAKKETKRRSAKRRAVRKAAAENIEKGQG